MIYIVIALVFLAGIGIYKLIDMMVTPPADRK